MTKIFTSWRLPEIHENTLAVENTLNELCETDQEIFFALHNHKVPHMIARDLNLTTPIVVERIAQIFQILKKNFAGHVATLELSKRHSTTATAAND